jgi:phage portal protein BeeE
VRFLDAILPATKPAPRRPEQRSASFTFGGYPYSGIPLQTTWGKTPAETIQSDFIGMIEGALKASPVVAAVEEIRVSVFSQARFLWQRQTNGRYGDMFGTSSLGILERPWFGAGTSDLLSRMLLHADFAGNAYVAPLDGELVLLRPDWTDIILAPRVVNLGLESAAVGYKRVGYAFYQDGDRSNKRPVVFLPTEVAHFAPKADPAANYRGMSWLTPVIRDLESDKAMTEHKGAFLRNAATPNMVISLPKEIDADDFEMFVEAMDRGHKGAENAYKTLYLAGGADPTVVGNDFSQMDFKQVQGAGETRVAAAGGVGAVLAKLSEGLQGSSLNAGNFHSARRLFGDTTAQMLWQNVAQSIEVIIPSPGPATRLWFDSRDVPFLRDDERDRAEIQGLESRTIRTLLDAGYEPDSVQAAVLNSDWSLLRHSGLYSVQLQAPGAQTPPAPAA